MASQYLMTCSRGRILNQSYGEDEGKKRRVRRRRSKKEEGSQASLWDAMRLARHRYVEDKQGTESVVSRTRSAGWGSAEMLDVQEKEEESVKEDVKEEAAGLQKIEENDLQAEEEKESARAAPNFEFILKQSLDEEGNELCEICMEDVAEDGNEMACKRGLEGISCILCPVRHGPMKPTDDGRWAHVACMHFVPETTAGDCVRQEPITGLQEVPIARFNMKCLVCQSMEGACVQCDYIPTSKKARKRCRSKIATSKHGACFSSFHVRRMRNGEMKRM
ncbi:hypothetical protein GUITHDRAFT_141407 [Guillardia theta CCMP2712]|uniref:PHD-type domain-containing protein n=1 Tax=Guillardia theta (strain CCMP2712) TaxID=905079 RepID=L1J245_GUITC|nr:hypothetical protein GUITHDRAFT_141407 [Guillardia theta CCMP2712]EKX42204.1 hypothetical protein GUITHDRAFT_141407 [Guillardia theta CCMP2712]|eukprot:XP_005829184.1 hypothetical protein GUITHDRAFT_141407 [Guillardia theta CCMP2712]